MKTACAENEQRAYIPQLFFSQPMSLPGGPTELEDGVDNIGVHHQRLMETLHKEGMAIAEERHRQCTQPQPPIIPPVGMNSIEEDLQLLSCFEWSFLPGDSFTAPASPNDAS